MADGTNASTEQMAAFASQADSIAQNLTSMLTTLSNTLQDTQARWIGKGGTSFGNTAQVVNAETAKLNTALTGIANDIRTAGVNYVQSDDDQSTQMTQAGSGATGITASLIV